jgi:hypothetical protein
MDRWQSYEIQNDELFEIKKNSNYNPHDLNSRYRALNERKKKSNSRVETEVRRNQKVFIQSPTFQRDSI